MEALFAFLVIALSLVLTGAQARREQAPLPLKRRR